MNPLQIDPREGWTSASNAEADSLCAGRHFAQKGLSEPESNAAAFGDIVHAAAAGEDVALNITQERVLEMAQQRRGKVLERFKNYDFLQFKELRLWATWRSWKHSGQLDLLLVDEKRRFAVVEDLKSLRGLVPESSENMQLRDQAVLVWLNFKVEEVVVYINQPMAGEQQKITRYDEATLRQAWSYMKLRIANSNDPAASRSPGTVQCLYCRARGVCPPAIEWDKANTAALLKRKENAAEMVARIAPEKLADIFSKSRTIISILDSVKARLLTLDDEQLGKLGLRKRAGYELESVNNNGELLRRLKSLKVTNKQFIQKIKVTKTALESIVREATEKKGRELDIQMDELLLGIVDKKPTGDRLEVIK